METISFKLILPSEILYSGDVDMVVVPASNGDIGIKTKHSPVIASIRPGTILICKRDEEDIRIFVEGGFLEIISTPTEAIVLAEQAVNIKDIDIKQLESNLTRMEDSLTTIEDNIEKMRVKKEISLAKLKILAVREPVYKK